MGISVLLMIMVVRVVHVTGEEEEEVGTTSAHVVELTDTTFEHLTQASTGATTGDWFVHSVHGSLLVHVVIRISNLIFVVPIPPAVGLIVVIETDP